MDQFGGVADSDLIVKLVREGKVTEARIDVSARRLLEQKFELGLFENPYVDPTAATKIVGKAEFKAAALGAQERSMVVLADAKKMLPAAKGKRVFLVGVDAGEARRAGLVPVKTAGEAEFALMRMDAPHQMLHPGYFFGSRQHEGDLDFKEDDPQYVRFQELV